MKKLMTNHFHVRVLITLLISLLFACKTDTKQTNKELTIIDRTKSYPKKDVILQNIAEVNYIPLETNDSVLIDQNRLVKYISQDTFIVGNLSQGDIFIFDKNGKLINKFNKKGQSGMEYSHIFEFAYSPYNQEIFTIERFGKNIQVYNINGLYKRSLKIPEKHSWIICTDFNDSLLMAYDDYNVTFKMDKDSISPIPFKLISKKDGRIVEEINMHIQKRINMSQKITDKESGTEYLVDFGIDDIVKTDKGLIVQDISTDTTYEYTKNQKLQPLFVCKPPILSMQKEKRIYEEVVAVSDKYIFLVTNTWDKNEQKYIRKNLCIDKNNNQIFECNLINKYFKDEDNFKDLRRGKLFEISVLKDALEEGKLSGKLKTIAEKANIDDNPVLMTVKLSSIGN